MRRKNALHLDSSVVFWSSVFFFTAVGIRFSKSFTEFVFTAKGCALLAQVPSFLLPFCPRRSEQVENTWRGTIQAKVSLCVSLSRRRPPTRWIFKSECFYELMLVPRGGSLFRARQVGRKLTHTFPARPEYDFIIPAAYYRSRDLWYAR